MVAEHFVGADIIRPKAGTPPLAIHDSLVNSLTLYVAVILLSLVGTS